MSTPERQQDDSEHGYGSANQDLPAQDLRDDPDEDDDGTDGDRRHVAGRGRGEGDGPDYPRE